MAAEPGFGRREPPVWRPKPRREGGGSRGNHGFTRARTQSPGVFRRSSRSQSEALPTERMLEERGGLAEGAGLRPVHARARERAPAARGEVARDRRGGRRRLRRNPRCDRRGRVDRARVEPAQASLPALPRGGWALSHARANDTEIDEFEPRAQETYTGDPVEAVFAT